MELIESVEKIRGKVRIILEDGTVYQLTNVLYLERPVSAGDTVDRTEFEKWLLLHQYRPALAGAVELLAGRACSESEVRTRLIRYGYMPETVDMVILKLSKEGFLNDSEFARQYVAMRSERLGTRRIRQDLLRKGVDRDTIDMTLDTVDPEDQLSGACELIRRSLRNVRAGEDPRKTRRRLLEMLARKGYSWEIGSEAVRKVFTADADRYDGDD